MGQKIENDSAPKVDVFTIDGFWVGSELLSIVHEQGIFHYGTRLIVVNKQGEVFVRNPTEDYFCPTLRGMAIRDHILSGETPERAAKRVLEPLGIYAEPFMAYSLPALDPAEYEQAHLLVAVSDKTPDLHGSFVPFGRLEELIRRQGSARESLLHIAIYEGSTAFQRL